MLQLFARKPRQKRIALVLGNAGYEHATRLGNALNDAAAVAAELGAVGFEVIEGRDLGYEATRDAIRRFLAAIDPGDVALLYYAGHGLQIAGENFILPVDADPRKAGAGLICVQTIISEIERSSGITLIFLDACRDDGGLSGKVIAELGRGIDVVGAARKSTEQLVEQGGSPTPPPSGEGVLPPEVKARFWSEHASPGLAKLSPGEHTFIAFAADPGDIALDGLPGDTLSPYSEAVVRYLGTRGLELFDFAQRVSKRVKERTKDRGSQHPWFNSKIHEAFYFKPRDFKEIWPLALFGALMGFVATFIRYTWGGAEPGEFGNNWWIAWNGIWFGIVLAYAAWRWDRCSWWQLALVALVFATASELAVVLMAVMDKAATRIDDPGLMNLLRVFGFVLFGAIHGFFAVASGAIVSPALRRIEPLAVCVVLGAVVSLLFVVYGIIYGITATQGQIAEGAAWLSVLVISLLGALWQGAMAAIVARAYILYVPESGKAR